MLSHLTNANGEQGFGRPCFYGNSATPTHGLVAVCGKLFLGRLAYDRGLLLCQCVPHSEHTPDRAIRKPLLSICVGSSAA